MNLRLLSLFVKNIDDKSPETHRKCGKAAGIIGIVSNFILFAMKMTIGILSSSIAITADAINNISDAGSSVITLVGFKLSEKPADDEHPYGHARIEYLTGFIVSLIITVIGVQFLKDSAAAIFEKTASQYSNVTIAVLVLSIAVKLWQASFYRSVGRHIGSGSLIATAADSRNDVISTAAVLVGAIVSRVSGVELDGYLGVLIALFIIYSGIKLIMETADPIIGSAPDDALVRELGEKIMSYDGIIGIHDLIIHNYGEGRCFASVHCEVSASEDILKSHDLIDNIEFDIMREKNIHLVIHLDPVVTDDENVNRLRHEVGKIVAEVSEKIESPVSMHDFRAVSGPTHTNLIFDIVLQSSCKKSGSEVSRMIESEIKKKDPSYNAVINVDRNYTTVTTGANT